MGETIEFATEQDAELLWQLRNEDTTRENSLHSDLIPWETHAAWYANKLKSSQTRIYVLKKKPNKLIAQARFEKKTAECAEINIAVAAGERGKGYGKKILSQTLTLIQNEWKLAAFEALVKEENQASIKLFKTCGFQAIERVLFNDIYIIKFKLDVSTLQRRI